MPLTDPVVINGSIVGAYNNKFNVQGVGLVSLEELLQYAITTAESGGGGGSGAEVYTNNGWIIRGTPGITVTNSISTGVYGVTIPEGGVLESLQRQFTNAGTQYTEDGDVVVNIAWNTTDYNNNNADSYSGIVSILDASNVQRTPADVGVTVSTISSGGLSNTIISGINGVGVPCRVKIIF